MSGRLGGPRLRREGLSPEFEPPPPMALIWTIVDFEHSGLSVKIYFLILNHEAFEWEYRRLGIAQTVSWAVHV